MLILQEKSQIKIFLYKIKGFKIRIPTFKKNGVILLQQIFSR